MREGKWGRKIRQMDEFAAREEKQQLQALEGKKTYQLYRDYLDNFRINAGRNSR